MTVETSPTTRTPDVSVGRSIGTKYQPEITSVIIQHTTQSGTTYPMSTRAVSGNEFDTRSDQEDGNNVGNYVDNNFCSRALFNLKVVDTICSLKM